MVKENVQAETAALLRRLLVAVERGELDAQGEAADDLVRHIEGAVAALEALGRAKGTSRT